MRIGYRLTWRGGRRTGPFKKIAAQVSWWAAAGHDVGLFVATGDEAVDDWRALPTAVCVETMATGVRGAIRARLRVHRALDDWQPDVIYLRHGLYEPGARRLCRRYPTVIEVNGDEIAVARNTSRLKPVWGRATRGLLLRNVRAAVFMTEEQATSRRFARYRFDRLVVPNGIDLSATAALAPSPNPRPGLVLIGHPDSPWHGADKLLALACTHPDWRFDIIGPNFSDLRGAPPANVTLHSELLEDDYLPVLAAADVGVGSLAMHRVGATQNPALKVREYLARGLPVITGCRDPDLDPDSEFILELPNDERNVIDHVAEIERFVEHWRGRRVDRDAISHLDIAAKESARLEFVARYASEDGKPTPI